MKKVLLGLVIAVMMTGCVSTINPDGSTTRGKKGSITWVLNAPIEYAVEYLNSMDTWRVCEIWDETLSNEPWITDAPKYNKYEGIAMRKRLAKSLESRGEDPMICRSTSNNKNTVKTKRKSNIPEMDYLGGDANAILRD